MSAKKQMMSFCQDTYMSSLGNIYMQSDGENLTALWFEGQHQPSGSAGTDSDSSGYSFHLKKERNQHIFQLTKRWLDIYFEGKEPDFMPPIKLEGTPFRKAVWELLRQIPYGHTVSYRFLAQQIAVQRGIRRMSAQAIGGAVGHNPVCILVPCHRVVGSDGHLTGYAGGIDKKIRLLQLE